MHIAAVLLVRLVQFHFDTFFNQFYTILSLKLHRIYFVLVGHGFVSIESVYLITTSKTVMLNSSDQASCHIMVLYSMNWVDIYSLHLIFESISFCIFDTNNSLRNIVHYFILLTKLKFCWKSSIDAFFFFTIKASIDST